MTARTSLLSFEIAGLPHGLASPFRRCASLGHRRQRCPACNRARAQTGIRIVRNARKIPPELDRRREFPVLLIGSANRGGFCLADHEHARTMEFGVIFGKPIRAGSAYRSRMHTLLCRCVTAQRQTRSRCRDQPGRSGRMVSSPRPRAAHAKGWASARDVRAHTPPSQPSPAATAG